MQNPIPSMLEAYSLLYHDEKSREVYSTQFTSESSGMNVSNNKQEDSVPTKRPAYVCTHCKKTGHKVEF